MDFGALAHQMTDQIHMNVRSNSTDYKIFSFLIGKPLVVDKHLQKWILPDFTTTSLSDTIICSVLMMSTLKAYARLILQDLPHNAKILSVYQLFRL